MVTYLHQTNVELRNAEAEMFRLQRWGYTVEMAGSCDNGRMEFSTYSIPPEARIEQNSKGL